MYRDYIILLLLMHVVGEFYVQTDRMARKMEESMKWLTIHCLSYLVTGMVIAIPVMSWEMAFLVTIATILHTLIDMLSLCYSASLNKRFRMTRLIERNLFFTTQGLHLIGLIMIAYLFTVNPEPISIFRSIAQFFDTLQLSERKVASWVLVLLFVHKPANIMISKMLLIYKPESDGKVSGAGSFIGTIERIIILIFLFIKQYSAIGLVLTAKSIARYDKIAKERDFAEYYLLGTLLSTILVIVVSFIL